VSDILQHPCNDHDETAKASIELTLDLTTAAMIAAAPARTVMRRRHVGTIIVSWFEEQE